MNRGFGRRSVQALWIAAAVLILIVVAALSNASHLGFELYTATLHEQTAAALIGSVFGALVGSITTTLGILTTDHLREKRNRDHERRVRHYNAVVNLQRELNVIRASLEDNTSALSSIIKANELGIPTLQRPIEIAMNESPFEYLYDIKLINMLNDLYYQLRRLNLDSVNLNRAQDVLAGEFFAGKISRENYASEVQSFNGNVIKLRKHILYMLDHSVLDLVAYVRICADRDASEEMKNRYKRMLDGRLEITPKDLQSTREQIVRELKEQEIIGAKEQAEEDKYD